MLVRSAERDTTSNLEYANKRLVWRSRPRETRSYWLPEVVNAFMFFSVVLSILIFLSSFELLSCSTNEVSQQDYIVEVEKMELANILATQIKPEVRVQFNAALSKRLLDESQRIMEERICSKLEDELDFESEQLFSIRGSEF